MQRGLDFTDVFNFRDLGGYRTADGRSVRWRRLFRSDDLSRLTTDEHDRFTALGIRTVVDLRRPNEIAADGRIAELDGVTYHHVHLVHPIWPSRGFSDTDERTRYVVERYVEMADASGEGFGTALRMIADEDAAPLVFHCIAGKDRTGILAALTLLLLGVPDADVVEDYHLSEVAEPASWARYTQERRPDLRGIVRDYQISPRAAMVGFLADLRTRYGSVESYAQSIGVQQPHIAAMREHLLAPVTGSAPAGWSGNGATPAVDTTPARAAASDTTLARAAASDTTPARAAAAGTAPAGMTVPNRAEGQPIVSTQP